VLFSVGFIALITLSLISSRSIARFSILTLFVVTTSGALLQFSSENFLSVTGTLMQWWLLGSAIALVVLANYFGRRRGAKALWLGSSNWILLGSSAVVTCAFFISRLLAPGELAPLSSVGFFVSKVAGEDNAKWLNATSQIADGTTIDTWANVGGPLLLFMTFAATMIAALSYLLYGSVNEVAVSAGSVIFVQVFFVIIAPIALSPIVEKTYRKLTGGTQLPKIYSFVSIVILTSSTLVLIEYGHITLQFTLIALTIWLGAFIAPIARFPGRLLTSISVIALSMVWFPLAGLSLVLALGSLAYFTRSALIRSGDLHRQAVLGLVASIGIFVITIQFLISALGYSLGVDGSDTAAGKTYGSSFAGGISAAVRAISAPTLPLFDDGGGTEQVTTLLLVLALVAVLGLVWTKFGSSAFNRSGLVSVLPMILVGGYALAIAFADFWAVGTGPNYGSLKVSFAVFIPILVVALPFALMSLNRGTNKVSAVGFTAVGAIVILLTLDTLLPRAVLQLKPTSWPSVAGNPYWYPAEVRDTGDQALASNPIGCAFLPRGAIAPSALPAGQTIYTCTRLLAGVAGVETLAAPVVKWQLDEWLQNRGMWSEMHGYFSGMSPEILSRQLILLDTAQNVIGLESLGGLLTRFPPVDF